MDKLVYVGESANKVKVYALEAYFAEHVTTAHNLTTADIGAVIGKCVFDIPKTGWRRARCEVICDRIIGNDEMVKTVAKEQIFYARRGRRPLLSRFVVGRKPEPTAIMQIVVGIPPKNDTDVTGLNLPEGAAVIYTAYPDQAGEREVGDKSLDTAEKRAVAKAFWANHAFCASAEQEAAARVLGLIK